MSSSPASLGSRTGSPVTSPWPKVWHRDACSQQWADQRARQWGEQSSLFRNRVLGEFAVSDQDGVIPLPWVEQANDRWRLWQDAGADFGPVTHLGVDIGRGHESRCFA